ncbi:MAG: pentapeptide repeat-containing protein [Chloroflexota bacterium]
MNEQPRKDWRDSDPFDAKNYKSFYQLVGGAFITVIILLIGGFIYSNPNSGYWINIYATLVGAVLAIAVIDRRAEERSRLERVAEAEVAENRATKQRKEELILQMGSPDNGFAVEAVRLLEQKGWLRDESLMKADLHKANLQGAYLLVANLQHAKLPLANLQNAYLHGANLYSADLAGANLRNTNLELANLNEAYLNGTNLEEALLYISTTLPDGSQWSHGRDLREFTHPDKWKAEQAAKKASSVT